MNLSDFERDVLWLQDQVTQLVWPFGWLVEVRPRAGSGLHPAGAGFEYRFTLSVKCPGSHYYGQSFGHLFTLSEEEWFMHHADRKWLQSIPMRWAQDLMYRTMNAIANPQMPTATEIDWRPTEMIPEDFRAA
jgi:hypothetical protein